MNALDLTTSLSAGAALPSSNPGTTFPLDLVAARSARDGLRSLLGAERSAAAEFLPSSPARSRRSGRSSELPVLRRAVVQLPANAAISATRTQGSVQTLGLASPIAPATAPRTEVEPLSADLRRLHVTVSERLLKKIAAARDGLSHSRPNATDDQILEAALDLLLEKQARSRGQVKTPRAVAAPAEPAAEPAPVRHRRAGSRAAIPAAVKRAVWARDGGRCSWPLDSGGSCGSTHRLELDHILPWARGGEETVANLRVVCRAHNATASDATFGSRVAGRYGAPRSR